MPESSAPILSQKNKRAPGSYPNNKGSIMRVWRAASFPTEEDCAAVDGLCAVNFVNGQ